HPHLYPPSLHDALPISLAHKHDDIYALATTQPYGGDKFLRELERAVKEDGCKGVIILSSLPGHYPDDDDALPFFELVTSLDIPRSEEHTSELQSQSNIV